MTLTPIDSTNRIQLPADWAGALRLRGLVVLERTDEGILVRPCPTVSWDDIFTDKLTVARSTPGPEPLEVRPDDLLF